MKFTLILKIRFVLVCVALSLCSVILFANEKSQSILFSQDGEHIISANFDAGSISFIDKDNGEILLENSMGDSLMFGYDQNKHQFFIDRSQSGDTSFSETFSAKPSTAPRTKMSDSLDIYFIVDKMSLEVFFDEGETVMTEIFFSQSPFETLSLKTNAETVKIENLQIRELSKK